MRLVLSVVDGCSGNNTEALTHTLPKTQSISHAHFSRIISITYDQFDSQPFVSISEWVYPIYTPLAL